MGKLTVKGVEKLVREGEEGRHADGGGLYLRVRAGGSSSWLFRAVFSDGKVSKRRDVAIGPQHTLEQARAIAADMRRVVQAGGNPMDGRKAKDAPKIPTFREAAIACHSANKPGWADKHAAAWLSSLEAHAFPRIGDIEVGKVNAQAIEGALQSIWLSKPIIARKLRHRICMTLNYAQAKHWRDDPAPSDALRQLLKVQSQPKGRNFAAMPFADVPRFVADMEAQPGTMGRLALLFLIATWARSGEVRTARVRHLDAEGKFWNRPADLMKGRIAHSVTLNDFALTILQRAAELRVRSDPDDFVFPGRGGKPLSDMTLSKIMRDAGLPFVPHGFRSSARTWAAEEMPTIPDPVAEAALAHTVADQVVAAYKRAAFLDMRRKLLDGWGGYLVGRSNVVRLAAG